MTTHIADIDYETIILYPGNYDDMIVAKSSVRERAEADAKSKEKKISQLSEFVAQIWCRNSCESSAITSQRNVSRLQPQDFKKIEYPTPLYPLPLNEKNRAKFY